MRTSFEVTELLFKMLNTASITNLIDGNIYRERRKEYQEGEKRLQDIAIVPLPIMNDFIQEGYVNVNCFSNDLSNGTPDITNLDAIAKAVIAQIEAYAGEPGGYFELEVDSQGTIQDERAESYVNLRIHFLIK